MEKKIRLDKFLAEAGLGTRSEVKKQIQKGKIRINDAAAKRPEEKISPLTDVVLFEGKRVGAAPEFVYYLLHKPAGCVSATQDARDKTVLDYVPGGRKGLFPVGRLDKDTEGLLLVTDDGALAHELLSPKKHVEKTYYVVVDGCVTEEDAKTLKGGVDIGEKNPTLPARLEILRVRRLPEQISPKESLVTGREAEKPCLSGWQSEINLTICEGKFHQVKRMMEAIGKKVVYLRRIAMGNMVLPADLKPGEWRPLSREEIEQSKKRL